MLRLVETNLAAAGKPDPGQRSPPFFLHVRIPDALLLECRDVGLEIVAHEIKFMPVILFGRMNRDFCRWHCKDQPAAASVHRSKSKDVTEESAISRRIFAVDDDMPTKDQPFKRKEWIERRLEELAEIFAVSLGGFSVLDNHLHVLLRLDPDTATGWSDEEVVRRWGSLFPPRSSLALPD
jgi:hypothetical protein